MDFTAIDFETATRSADSACQLAAVRVRGGEIVSSASWLIRPRPLRFDHGNILIHGITPQQVRNEPEFGELWPQIRQTLGDDCLIAHNASFDLGVLIACLRTHEHPVPEMSYSCTRAIARRVWPTQPRYGLKPLSDWLGIRFKHHDALEDSIACAKIAIAAAQDIGASSTDELEAKLKLSRGAAGEWGKRGPANIKRTPTRRASAPAIVTEKPVVAPEPSIDLQRWLVRADFIRPLSGRRVVFTGTLSLIDRGEAELITTRAGGVCQTNVTRQTDFVVVGQTDARTRRLGRTMSSKEAKAREIVAAGGNVEFLSENQFLELIALVQPSTSSVER